MHVGSMIKTQFKNFSFNTLLMLENYYHHVRTVGLQSKDVNFQKMPSFSSLSFLCVMMCVCRILIKITYLLTYLLNY